MPSEGNLNLSFNGESHKWVITFDRGYALSDEDLLIEPFMFTDEGVVVEEVVWSGPVGTAYKNGKGTRAAASNTSITAELL